MSQATRELHQTITRWPYQGPNGYGGFEFGAPSADIKGRWEERTEEFTTANGTERVSNAIVYLDTDVEVDDWLAQGDQTNISDPTTLEGAYKIDRFDRKTDLRNIETIRKAFL